MASNGLWLLPTRKRPENLIRFFKAAAATGMSTPGLVVIDADDPTDYRAIELPKGWEYWHAQPHAPGSGDAFRQPWERIRHLDWIGLLADDNVPESPLWDTSLIGKLEGWNFVSSNDGWRAPYRIHGGAAFSGDLIRAVGWLAAPGFNHLFIDTVWETIGSEAGVWTRAMDVMIRHAHAGHDGDEVYRATNLGPGADADLRRFREWMEQERPEIVRKVGELRHARGAERADKPDLGGVSILIATPSLSGRLDKAYVSSLNDTLRWIAECGGKASWATAIGSADIALVRNSMAARFLATDCTHLLMIDDDMAWNYFMAAELCSHDLDFVAAAGRKKSIKPEFAVNFGKIGDEGPVRIEIDTRNGLYEVLYVGMAFALLSRVCIETMDDAYTDLGYNGESGRETALFDPMIIEGGHRLSESYSFCERWRAIGGKIWLNPAFALSHTGTHAYNGAVMDMLTLGRPEG